VLRPSGGQQRPQVAADAQPRRVRATVQLENLLPMQPLRFRPVHDVLTESSVIAALAAIALIVRLPEFFPAVVNLDESTFIIMGQSILDGFLPYTVWDPKPPYLFLFFAGAIALFGKTIVSVRLAGYLWLTIAAFLTYLSAYKITGERCASLFSAILLIVAASVLDVSEVNSQIIALVPLVAALLLLISGLKGKLESFCTGLLMGTAAMFRFNLGYPAIRRISFLENIA
jgi:4-amino-4-deoxy-L-arabinose transferase-like glycosyltransferase